MQSIDKNDVDISRLFRWGKEVEIKDSHDTPIMKVHMRLIGDADVNRARVYALRKSAELRKLLRTEGTDERLAFMPDPDMVDKENVVEMILSNSVTQIARNAVKDLDLRMPQEPDSDATLEEQEKYQAEVDAWPQKRQERIEQEIMAAVERERERMLGLSDEKIRSLYENKFVDTLCEAEMNSRYMEMCIFFGTYSDPDYKHRLFKSIDQLLDLPTDIRDQLTQAYLDLDIVAEDLKK